MSQASVEEDGVSWIEQGYLLRSIITKREFQFVYICSLLSNKHFTKKQNGEKLHLPKIISK